MGVEPTDAGITDAHAVLKTGEATGPLPPPSHANRHQQSIAARAGIWLWFTMLVPQCACGSSSEERAATFCLA